MVRLYANGRQLILPVDLRGSLILKSPILFPRQEGSLSLPFTISALEAENLDVLGYTNNLATWTRELEFAGRLEIGPFRLDGILRTGRITNRLIECALAVPPGNIPAEMWEKLLSEFDLGTVSFEQYLQNKLTKYSLAKVGDTIKAPETGTLTLKLKRGNTEVFSKTYGPDDKTLSSAGALLNDFAVAWIATNPTGLTAFATGGHFLIKTDTGGQTPTSLTTQYQPPGGGAPAREGVATFEPYTAPVFSSINDVKPHPFTVDERFAFPMIMNKGAYASEDNKAWNGYVNNYHPDTGYKFNDEDNPTRYAISPMIRLTWLIGKLFDLIGYDFTPGLSWSASELKNLVVYTNRFLDRLSPGLLVPFNVYQPSFKIGDQLPELTLEQLSDELFALFAARIVADPVTRTATIVFMRDVLASSADADWTDRVVGDFENENETKKVGQLQFKMDSDTAASEQLAAAEKAYKTTPDLTKVDTLFFPYPYQVDKKLEVEQLTTAFSPLTVEVLDVTRSGYIDENGNYVRGFETTKSRTTAVVKQQAISELFDQAESARAAPRVGFLISRSIPDPAAGDRTGSGLEPIIVPTLENQLGEIAITWYGENGLFSRFWKDYFAVIRDGFQAEYPMIMSELDLATWAWDKKKQIYGLNFLPAQIKLDFSIDGLKPVASVTWYKA